MNVFELFAKLSLDSSEYEAQLDKAKSAGSSIGSSLASAAKVGLKAVAAATTAMAGFGVASLKTGAEFDTSMSQVAATMGTTVDQIEDLRNFALEMGRTTAFSATQAADALNYMALAGYDAETSMAMLPNVLNLAAAGSIDLARASDMITDTQTAFGISLERTTQMVDEMAKAASTGNTSVEQLGDAFLTVGGLAQELNGGFVTLDDGTEVAVDGVQELEIALTAMANAGVKGSEAGTHMRNMLLKLSSPTDQGAAALEELGVAVFDAEGNMNSLKDIMGGLNEALSELTQEQKIQYISDLFNTRDLASAEALLNAVGQDWDAIGASILDAEGAAEQMKNTQLDNLAGDITLFKSALEGAQIAVSDQLKPAVRDFVQFGTAQLGRFTEFVSGGGLQEGLEYLKELFDRIVEAISPLTEKLEELFTSEETTSGMTDAFTGAMDLLVEAISLASTGLAFLIDIVSSFIGWLASGSAGSEAFKAVIVGLTAAFVAYKTAMIVAEAATKAMEIAQLALNIAMNANPIGLLVLAITGLVAAFAYLWNSCEDFRNFWVDLWAGISGVFNDIWDGIVSFFTETIPSVIGDAIAFFAELPMKAIEWGADLIQSFIDGIVGAAEALWDCVGDIAGGIADFLGFSEPEKGPLSNFHTYAPDMMDLFAQGIEDNKGMLLDTVADAFDFQETIVGGNQNAVANDTLSSQSGDIMGLITEALSNIVVDVSIGTEKLDSMITKSIQRTNYRSGGR